MIRVAIVEGYECNAYGYILKENMIEKLPPALEIMLEDLKTTLIMRSGGQIKFDTLAKEAIYYGSILFWYITKCIRNSLYDIWNYIFH